MTEQVLVELLQKYTDLTSETTTYTKHCWVRPQSFTYNYDVHVFDGVHIKDSIIDTSLESAIGWVKGYTQKCIQEQEND